MRIYAQRRIGRLLARGLEAGKYNSRREATGASSVRRASRVTATTVSTRLPHSRPIISLARVTGFVSFTCLRRDGSSMLPRLLIIATVRFIYYRVHGMSFSLLRTYSSRFAASLVSLAAPLRPVYFPISFTYRHAYFAHAYYAYIMRRD